jgi:hypothetical protein
MWSKSPPTEAGRGLDVLHHLHGLGAKSLRDFAVRVDTGLTRKIDNAVRTVYVNDMATGGRG